MSNTIYNPYPEYNFTYNVEADTAQCKATEARSHATIASSEDKLSTCYATLLAVVGTADMNVIADASSKFVDAKRKLDAAKKNAGLHVFMAKAMETADYKMVPCYKQLESERWEGEKRMRTMEKADQERVIAEMETVAREVMKTLDDKAKAKLNQELIPNITDDTGAWIPYMTGQLVACRTQAQTVRSLACTSYYSVGVVLKMDGAEHFWIAFCDNADAKPSGHRRTPYHLMRTHYCNLVAYDM